MPDFFSSQLLNQKFIDLLSGKEESVSEDTLATKTCTWCHETFYTDICYPCHPQIERPVISSPGMDRLAQAGSDYIRSILREQSFAMQIMPPTFFDTSSVTKGADNSFSPQYDTLVKIDDED
jgi:hypothetical protein